MNHSLRMFSLLSQSCLVKSATSLIAIVVCFLFLAIKNLPAQDYRIYTKVFDENVSSQNVNGESKQKNVVSRSLTLFHGGKVYDYINSLGEVIIFEPVHRRFTILNISRSLSTTVEFETIEKELEKAKYQTRNDIKKLDRRPTPTSKQVSHTLKFQLNPEFQEEFQGASQELTLTHSNYSYRVKCAAINTKETIEGYLRYADWMARLNYVLHPSPLLPGPRLALNTSLRKRSLFPTEVELKFTFKTARHLRAEHQIQWQLGSRDRDLIHRWETMLKSDQTKQIVFGEYQRTIAP